MLGRVGTRTFAGIAVVALLSSLVGVATTSSADAVAGAGGVYVPVTPTRIVDTDSGVGGSSNPIGPLGIRSYEVLGTAGVPSTGVSAVVVDVAVTNASTSTTKLTVYPTGEVWPNAVTMYYSEENSSRSNTTIVKVGTGGKISVRNVAGNTDINLDIQGYFTSTSDENSSGGYVPITPVRVADSTTGAGVPQAKLAGQEGIDVQVSETEGVPADATAVFANVEVQASNLGELIIVKGGESVSNVPAAVTYQDNGPTSSGVMLQLSGDGKIRLHNTAVATSGGVDFKVDVQGYFSAASDDGSSYQPLTATEIYSSTDPGSTQLGGGETRVLPVGGIAGIPTDGSAAAAVLSLSVRDWTADGTLTSFPADDEEPPETTNLSFAAGLGEPSIGSTVTAIVPMSSTGEIKVRNTSSSAVTLFVSAQGWFTDSAPLLAEACGLPGTGELATNQVAEGLSALACGLVGRLVTLTSGIGVTVPEPGEVASVDAEIEDGPAVHLSLAVSADGVISYPEDSAEQSGLGLAQQSGYGEVNASTGPDHECNDYAYTHKYWKEYGTYNWYIGDGGMPAGLSRATARDRFADAINNITTGHSNCHNHDLIGAQADYKGYTTYEADINSRGACTKRDKKSTWDAGNVAAIATACSWMQSIPGAKDDLLEADVRYNTTDYDFTNDPGSSSCSNKYDVEGVGTHEAGHVFGMGHVGSSHYNLTMYTTSFKCTGGARTLGAGDYWGLEDLY